MAASSARSKSSSSTYSRVGWRQPPPPPHTHLPLSLVAACLQVQRDFEELPQGAAQSLRDSLVTLLVKHCQGNAAVRTQLCLAVAALASHLPAAQWDPTSGVVGWLAQRLGGEAQNVSLPCMLELLTVLPQVGSKRTRNKLAADVGCRCCFDST